MSSDAHASTCGSGCSASRARYSSRSAERPVAPTGSPGRRWLPQDAIPGSARAPRRPGGSCARLGRGRRPAPSPSPSAGRAPSGHSLNSSVSHRPNRPGGGVGEVGDQLQQRLLRASGERRDRLRVARPSAGIGSPTRIRTVRPKPSQLVPLIATGTIGTPARSAKNAVPSASGRSSRSPRWIRPSPKMTMTQPSSSTRWTRRAVSSRSVFSGRYGIAKPAHDDQPVPAADGHVRLLRPEHARAWASSGGPRA